MEVSIPVHSLTTKQLLTRALIETLAVGATVTDLTDKLDAFLAAQTSAVQQLKAALEQSQADDAADEATIKALQDEVASAIAKIDAASAKLPAPSQDAPADPGTIDVGPVTVGGGSGSGDAPDGDTTDGAPEGA